MVTIKDVASHAGVSVATVSRVINNVQTVSTDIKEKVELAINELNYFPNYSARSLVKRENRCIAVVLRNLHSPYHSPFIKGIEEAAKSCNRKVIFCSIGSDAGQRDSYIQFLTNGVADGIIFYGSRYSDRPLIAHLKSVDFPFLMIENNNEAAVNQFVIDNYQGAIKAVNYLVQNGHRRIAHFMGNPNKKINLDRFNGYIDGMKTNNILIPDDYIYNIFDSADHAYKTGQDIVRLPAEHRPTAIFCNNDIIAAHAIQGILDAGLTVPDDISVISFDNQKTYEFNYTGPEITCILQPLFELGRESIEFVTNLLDNKITSFTTKTFTTSLVKNQTVKNITK